MTFFFGEEEGRYKLPVSLGPKASTTIDVSKIIAAQQPDADGKVIPLGTREGSFVFSSAAGMTEWMSLVASVGILNVQTATCGTECVSCCGYTAQVSPSSATIRVGGTVTLVASALYCNGTTPVAYPNGPVWSSSNTAVATVVGGVVTGQGPGSAGITARTISPVVIVTGRICNQSGTCPTGYLQAGANVNVLRITVALSPSTVAPGSQTTVTVTREPVASGRSVTLTASEVQNSGGHQHLGRPLGSFGASSGTTDSNGQFRSTYTASVFGGAEVIKATVDSVSGSSTLGVAVSGLTLLGGGTNYELVGATATHPDNHYGTSNANSNLVAIADQYAAAYPGSKLRYNDQSLREGGLFDTNANWQTPHISHRIGTDCDVSKSNVPSDRHGRVMEIFLLNNASIPEEDAAHWHIRF